MQKQTKIQAKKQTFEIKRGGKTILRCKNCLKVLYNPRKETKETMLCHFCRTGKKTGMNSGRIASKIKTGFMP